MLRKKYFEIFIFLISFLSILVSGFSIQQKDSYFSLFDYIKEDVIYFNDYKYDDYLTLRNKVNNQLDKEVNSIFYNIIVDHENRVYHVYYDGDINFFGVPLLGTAAYGKVIKKNDTYKVRLPRAITHKDNKLTNGYLNYSYSFYDVVPGDIEGIEYVCFNGEEIELSQLKNIEDSIENDSVIREAILGKELVSMHKMGVKFYYVIFQAMTIVPILFGFVISFIFYKMNNVTYFNDLLIKRINGISKFRLYVENICVFAVKLIIPIILGQIIGVVIYLFFGIKIITITSVIVFLTILFLILIITAFRERKKVFKYKLSKVVR